MLGSSFLGQSFHCRFLGFILSQQSHCQFYQTLLGLLCHVKRIIFESNRSFDTSTPSRPYPDKVGLHQGNLTHKRGYIERSSLIHLNHSQNKFDTQERKVEKVRSCQRRKKIVREDKIKVLGYLFLTRVKILGICWG